MNNKGAGIDIYGVIGTVGGDIIGGNKITINIVNPIGKIIEAETPPGPNMHADRERGFSISWPKDSDWISSNTMGAYQLSQLSVRPSEGFSLFFGLMKREWHATFGVFKTQLPQGECVGFVLVDIYTVSTMKMSQLESLVGAMTFRGVRDSGRVISQNLFSWDGVRWNWCNAVAPEIVFGAGDSPYNYIARIIRGDHHVYTIGSPIYPATSAYDNLREETTAVLNSFKLL
jgi:hypothetical protein